MWLDRREDSVVVRSSLCESKVYDKSYVFLDIWWMLLHTVCIKICISYAVNNKNHLYAQIHCAITKLLLLILSKNKQVSCKLVVIFL